MVTDAGQKIYGLSWKEIQCHCMNYFIEKKESWSLYGSLLKNELDDAEKDPLQFEWNYIRFSFMSCLGKVLTPTNQIS